MRTVNKFLQVISFAVTPKNVAVILLGALVGLCIASVFEVSLLRDYWSVRSKHDLQHSQYGQELVDTASSLQDASLLDQHKNKNNAVHTKSRNDSQHEEGHTAEDRTVANRLYNDVKILCWIMTNPSNHKTKAIHIQNTWGLRCNKLLFMSSAKDDEIDTIALPVAEGREALWAKTKEAFKYIYAHHLNEYDWFLKADDDSYVILENLRFLLYPYSNETPIYFGCKFNKYANQGYMSGGAGYVLSREALRRFVEVAIPDKDKCRQDGDGAEDAEVGKCLENVDVSAGDSRDAIGRGRFFPFDPVTHMFPGRVTNDYWYWNMIYYKTDEGLDCFSDNTISFHYIAPNYMYVLDYLIYRLQPYGIVEYPQRLPHKLTRDYQKSAPESSVQTKVETTAANYHN